MDYSFIKEKLETIGQEHLLRFYDELDDEGKDRLLNEINNIDFSDISIEREASDEDEVIEPLSAMTLEGISKRRAELYEKGISAIRSGKVAAVLLAGGQGTRLGIDGPKGAFNIGLTKDIYIFQCLINNLCDVTNAAGCPVPLLIMTSKKNDRETREFFEAHDFFGYDRDNVIFFVQEMAPATDYSGKIYLEAKDHVALSPNGNGGWFKSIVRAGLLPFLKERGVEWLNVFSVDNVLQRIADPVFIGATLESGAAIGSKVVGKASPDERVGVMCMRNGHPSIVEYYELTENMANERGEDGNLVYNWGVILNYLLNMEELEKIEQKKLPLHIVEKKIPYISENGESVKPESPNGYKFETLILDMISMMDGCLAFEVDRSKEFAPVKNAEGKDSPETARELLKGCGVEL